MNSSKLQQFFPEVKPDELLSAHTTFRVGGRARGYLRVQSAAEFESAVVSAHRLKLPYRVIAGGSNVVFGDKLYSGLVIQWLADKPKFDWSEAPREMVVESGVPLAFVIKAAVTKGWSGLETLSGIPGTVGGAVVGNAGAYGHSISESVKAVEILDLAKAQPLKRWVSRAQCRFAYRESIFKHQNWLVLRVRFSFGLGDAKALAKKSREIIKLREKKYAPGLACPGSFFKNVLSAKTPKKVLKNIDQAKIIEGKIPAGYLLEQVGAKGLTTGRLKIADFHGNLIVNQGGATYREVKNLAALLKKKVKNKFGIELEEEVRYMV